MSLKGQTVGVYRVVEELGRGAHGVVYRCTHKNTRDDVALKLLPKEDSDAYRQMRSRMEHEAAFGVRVRHPNVVRTLATGELNEGCYLIQEMLRGQPLHRILREQTRPGRGLPPRDAYLFGEHLARGLYALHANGIVHADFKSSNVLLSDRPVIVDLGLAIDEGEARPDRQIMGTPSYMAPEVIDGEPLTRAADAWSLGVVLCELFCGARPFGLRTDSPEQIMARVKIAKLPNVLGSAPEGALQLLKEIFTLDLAERLTDTHEIAERLYLLSIDADEQAQVGA